MKLDDFNRLSENIIDCRLIPSNCENLFMDVIQFITQVIMPVTLITCVEIFLIAGACRLWGFYRK